MAPVLRKKKVVVETKKDTSTTTAKVVEKSTTKTKRKAPDDASPVSVKKQKSTKKTSIQVDVDEKPVKKPVKSKESRKSAKQIEVTTEKVVSKSTADEPESEDDKDIILLADELDSGDDDAAEEETSQFKPGQDVGNVPAVSADVRKTANKKSTGERGVIYVGRIPHGFYEHEMRQYMTQFGPITRLRLSRNPKTGASRHFAFVEFEDASTAEIVAKTMNNYLLFGHILKVKVVPKSRLHDDVFKGANRRFKKVPWNKMAGRRLEKPRTESAWEAKVEKERVARQKKAAKLKALGYDFEAPEIKDLPPPAPRLESGEDEKTKTIEPPPASSQAVDEAASPQDQVEERKKSRQPEPTTSISQPKSKTRSKSKAQVESKASKSGKSKKKTKV